MSQNRLYQIVLDNYQLRYDIKNVTKCIVVLRNTKSVKAQEIYKKELFIAVSKLIMKSVNNFFKLVKNVPEHKRLHTNEDIAGECYLVLDRCVTNVKPEFISKFYFYLNNSLNKAIYRLYEKNYQKHFDIVDDSEEQLVRLESKGYHDHFDLTEVDLSSLTELEMDIIKAKLLEEKQKSIIKRLRITNEEFYLAYESAKNKITLIYERRIEQQIAAN